MHLMYNKSAYDLSAQIVHHDCCIFQQLDVDALLLNPLLDAVAQGVVALHGHPPAQWLPCHWAHLRACGHTYQLSACKFCCELSLSDSFPRRHPLEARASCAIIRRKVAASCERCMVGQSGRRGSRVRIHAWALVRLMVTPVFRIFTGSIIRQCEMGQKNSGGGGEGPPRDPLLWAPTATCLRCCFSHQPCRSGQHCCLKSSVRAEQVCSKALSIRQAGDAGCKRWLAEVLMGSVLT